jgi:AraC-like DNA-binding protein
MSDHFHWAGAAHLMLRAAEQRGVEPAHVLERARVSAADLPPSPARMPWAPLRALTLAALELTGEAGLGLLAGKLGTVHGYGVVGFYCLQLSPARAVQQFAYEEVWPRLSTLVRFRHEGRGNQVLHRGALLVPRDCASEAMLHLFLSQHVAGYLGMFGPEAHVDHLALYSRDLGYAAHLSALAGCRVLTGQRGDWVTVPQEAVERPLHLADLWLREHLRPQMEAVLRMLDEGSDATLAVHLVVERALSKGVCPDLEAAANTLNTRPRVLRARLAAEDTTFSAVLDSARKEYTLRQLAIPGVKPATVGARIGFSRPAAFTRAFRRWTGTRPSQWSRHPTA